MRSNDTSTDQDEHSARLVQFIAGEIAAAGGWLSFERFMDLALYAPGLGYYSGGAQKLGASGDFITAPEVSGLFGACVAAQCAEVLSSVSDASILEIGAGSGRLAVDVLARLEAHGLLPQHYFILEISADLRDRQRRLIEQRLPHLLSRVQWLDAPPLQNFEGVILANEVLDALPVARFRWHAQGIEELGIGMQGTAFAERARPASPEVAAQCAALLQAAGTTQQGPAQDGYVSEYCPRLGAWSLAVTRALSRGLVLWIDYGLPRNQYYLPERHDGTLLCHFRHRANNEPLLRIGLQDITAWVDFTRLAEAGSAAGFEVAGFATQALFLAGLKIDAEMHRAAGGDENQFARLANQARQLMLPGEMGERFKAMAWTRALDLPLSGFALQDLRHTL